LKIKLNSLINYNSYYGITKIEKTNEIDNNNILLGIGSQIEYILKDLKEELQKIKDISFEISVDNQLKDSKEYIFLLEYKVNLLNSKKKFENFFSKNFPNVSFEKSKKIKIKKIISKDYLKRNNMYFVCVIDTNEKIERKIEEEKIKDFYLENIYKFNYDDNEFIKTILKEVSLYDFFKYLIKKEKNKLEEEDLINAKNKKHTYKLSIFYREVYLLKNLIPSRVFEEKIKKMIGIDLEYLDYK